MRQLASRGEPVAASRDATKGRPRAGPPMVVVRAPKGVEGSMLILMALAVIATRGGMIAA
ncbi:Putative uncharacterized protein [Propionibacterium freudenreichii subsp. freudenreichii]|nr:Putative uncharacterized protein [Propionibacterium freudenreichii subsp. freudenreichii]CEG98785.1 Protein of unknown function [Propionibacterium freudenreichii]